METTLFEKAVELILTAHHGQTRKDGKTPYVLHPMEAAAIAATLTQDEEIIIAVLLHDTLEDTPTTKEELQEKFGNRIAELVAAESENKREDRPAAETWQIRKEESLAELENHSDPAVKILWMADKLSNMRSLYRLYREKGLDGMWEHFHQKDTKKQEWYYRSVAKALSSLADTAAYEEYCRLVDAIFGVE